jgi:hypothetical protein
VKKISAIFIFVIATAISNAALAGMVQVSGTHSESEIAGACKKAGGVSFSDDNGTYGCETPKGNIKCTNGNCVGKCDSCGSPTIARGKGGPVLGILSGTTLKAGPGAVAKNTPQTPAGTKMPGEQKDSGAMHSDEMEHGRRK